MKTGISKKQSLLLYGFAIIFMIYHHTFCIPSRLHYDYFSVLGFRINFLNNSIETTIAWFCKICVAIFAFLTGYGFSIKLNFSYKNPFIKLGHSYLIILKKIGSLIFKLFLVLIVIVPLYYFVNYRFVSFEEFVSNLLGLSSSLNGEWWYINFYFSICLLFPLLDQIFYKGYKNKFVQISFIVVCSAIIVFWFLFGKFFVPDLKYSLIVLEGYLVSRFKVFEYLSNKTTRPFNTVLSIILLVLCVLLRMVLAKRAAYRAIDVYIIFPFIYSILNLIPEESTFCKAISFFGKHSTYMWLTHTFFEYYIFSRFITISGISTIIYLQTIAASLLTSFALLYVEKVIIGIVKHILKLIKSKTKTQKLSN